MKIRGIHELAEIINTSIDSTATLNEYNNGIKVNKIVQLIENSSLLSEETAASTEEVSASVDLHKKINGRFRFNT